MNAWRRFDTLFLRLFLLLWVTLVASHLLAFSFVVASLQGPGGGPGQAARPPGMGPGPGPGGPGGPGPGGPGGGFGPPPGDGGRPGLPPVLPSLPPSQLPGHVLWWDYGLRALVIGIGAALGARWLSSPMRRLAQASDGLAAALARGQAPPQMNEAQGTVEVRRTARVFNTMARRLQEQFDARGMHLAALSHDLRTPLTRLRMRLEDAPPEVVDGAAADIHEMSEMMDGTLAVLREQRDGSTPDLIDLRSLLEALVDDQRVAGHDVALALPDSAAPLRARARPAALRRVLDNLVGNALRYGGNAQLSAQALPGAVFVTVDDRGPGIPEAQLELAFRPWVRLASSHARAGHGLGLAIARDLAERDGGQLTLSNRPQGGLQARLRLPTDVSAPT